MDNDASFSSDRHLSQPPAESPRLCARDCGFFGSAANDGLCSKCYKDYLKEKISESESVIIQSNDKRSADLVAATISQIEELNDSIKALILSGQVEKEPVTSPVPVQKNRCGFCKKKVGLLGFMCRCGGTFCGTHRYPEAHPCDVDYKTAGKIKIEKQNPLCAADKISDRI